MTIFVDNYKVNKNLGKSMNTTQSIMKKSKGNWDSLTKTSNIFHQHHNHMCKEEETFKGII